MGHNNVNRGLFFVAVAAAAWGVGGFVAAVLYDHSGLGPIAVTFWRYLGGILLLAAMRPLRGRTGTPTSWKLRTVNGLGMALYQTTYYVAIDLTGVAVATIVVLGSGPVLVAIGARVLLKERLQGTIVATSLVGLVLLIGVDGTVTTAGLAVALVSAAGYAGVTLLNRAAKDDPYDAALGGFAVGTVVLLPLAMIEGLLPTRGGTGETVALLAFLGAVPTALAYALFFAGLSVVRATTASVVALVEPLAAVALGVLVLHEPLTGWSAAGAGLLLTSVLLLSIAEHQARRRTTATTANAPAATAAARPQIHKRDGDAAGGGTGLATAGGDCAGRDVTTADALTGEAPAPVTTTVHVAPAGSTGPEE
ncbi:EamA family transporter [Dactylosporangium sp. NPDC005555]|uniref:DMT family transporter n=1 Tax=Dactylosporangium sp. NPDC005555 TaxID=3154889 RepID=UPI0033A0F69F